jgi:acetyl/propionyl-CoA carboxylase alpha subunit/acetyl-CoA carboxylase carboxyltransferase component
MQRDFQRVAIINHSEAAMRLITAVREFNQENGIRLRTIALYTDPNRRAMFVREADETESLGPAPFLDNRDGQRRNTYPDYKRLEEALVASRADAVWVGWGFASDHGEFADLCDRLGIVFIGPPADAIWRLGDKITAKRLAAEAGIPVIPWSGGPVETVAEAQAAAERIGFPLLIKPTAGARGRGIRKVHTAEEIAGAFEGARSQALLAFGNPTLFLERHLEGARQAEVQIFADQHGTTWAIDVKDCTIQRDRQKILAESPPPALRLEEDQGLRQAAICLSRMAGYQNAGTVEFLYDPQSRRFSFLEVNPWLPMEHRVTEVTTGLDLVKLQLHIARGGRLQGEPPASNGHAIGVRLDAEDQDAGFAPAPGTFAVFRLPTGPGLRIDHGVTLGDAMVPEYDSMIAYVIAHGRNRTEALSRMQRALLESAMIPRGGTTTKAFLLELLAQPDMARAEIDTGWLDRWIASRREGPRPHAAVALLHAAVEAYDGELAIERAQFYASAARMRPEVHNGWRTVEFQHRRQHYALKVFRQGPQEYRVDAEGRRVDVHLDRLGASERWLTVGGKRHRVVSDVQGVQNLVEVDGFSYRFSRGDLGVIRASVPAVVASVNVKDGDEVAAGDRLAVLEAMKMEMPVLAPFRGRVRQVFVMTNVHVAPGAALLHLDPVPVAETQDAAGRIRLEFPPPPTASAEAVPARLRRTLDAIRRLVLGYDADPPEMKRLAAEYADLVPAGAPADAKRRRTEDEILGIFADVSALFRRQTVQDDPEYLEALSSGEYQLIYLRTLNAKTAGLPPKFIEQLRRTLLHYGVESLDRTPALEEALLWLYKSHQRMEQHIPIVLGILRHRLAAGDPEGTARDLGYHLLLDRLIAAAENLSPTLSDLAGELRYRTFDRPLFDCARKRVYDEVEIHLAHLRRDPEAPDRRERVQALVECPQPLHRLLMFGRFEHASAPLRQLMLEVLSRRYYKIREFESFRSLTVEDGSVGVGQYLLEGKRIHLLTTTALDTDLPAAAERLRALVARVPADEDAIIDFYLWRNGSLGDPQENVRALKALLDRVSYGRPIRRVVLALAGSDMARGMGGVQHFTFRPSAEGYREDAFYRGLHPMMGKRLHLSRLTNFEIERLPSVEDVYLFRGVARENPKDERLFALAEVRDLTPIQSASRRIASLPHLERMLMEALAAIRAFQSKRRPEERLQWNSVFLYVWPPFLLGPSALDDLMHKLGPATEGLGLEKIALQVRMPQLGTSELRAMTFSIVNRGRAGFVLSTVPTSEEPIRSLTEYEQKVVRMRQRGMTYPYEIIRMLTCPKEGTRSDLPPGEFQEFDLDLGERLAPVTRPYGQNRANVVVGLVQNFTAKVPEGMTRVILLGDPSREMGSTAEPECKRVIAALDLAEQMGVPLEWFTISAGAKISMDSGTENMDWISRVLRRLIEFTQRGGEINIVDFGINVGGQSYWNAEATMLLHTRGILIMTQDGAMVLTGKTALDYSGSISAEDNFGIGGYERVMGPNGQAQYWARDIGEACQILLRHYDHTYVVPGERFPRRAMSVDPFDRDVCASPHARTDPESFALVGEIFSNEKNPGRKRPFDIRSVMAAAVDQDHRPLERWTGWRDAENAVVWDAHLGGYPVCLLGIESRPLPRVGFVPTDGPNPWTAGTLFPQSSKKIARAINSASGNRPLVILANLSGFDGSPESMRRLQLEYGAEIGRANVNFKGPIVFCVISRYHGGAFVVFSKPLNDSIEAAALEGTYASVIGGAPAAAVVFAREVDARTRKDSRLQALEQEILAAGDGEKRTLRARLAELTKAVRSEKLGEVAEEFDGIHSVQRALKVGSLDRIIPAATLRPYLIEALERGMAREWDTWAKQGGQYHETLCDQSPWPDRLSLQLLSRA